VERKVCVEKITTVMVINTELAFFILHDQYNSQQ
jgi:hypothetical protein